MNEAKLIVPMQDNDGEDILSVRDAAIAALIENFGGCTVTAATGYWSNEGKVQREPVWELVVACEPDALSSAHLRTIAENVARDGRQHTVYLRHPDGAVEFVNAPVELSAVA